MPRPRHPMPSPEWARFTHSAIESNVKHGVGCEFILPCNIYGATFGDYCRVGPYVEVQKGVVVGSLVKIASHTFICSGVIIKSKVFIGHHVCTVNDLYPKASVENRLTTEEDWECVKTIIEDGASIGSGSTLLGGIRIGANSIVGAGSVVTRDVPDNVIVVGNPARILRRINN